MDTDRLILVGIGGTTRKSLYLSDYSVNIAQISRAHSSNVVVFIPVCYESILQQIHTWRKGYLVTVSDYCY